MTALERAIWNWMDTYPGEFSDLQVCSNCSVKFFSILDEEFQFHLNHILFCCIYL